MYYNAIFELPDEFTIDEDFTPELSVGCLSEDGEKMTKVLTPVTEPLFDLSKVSELKPDADSVIMFKFKDGMAAEDIGVLRDILKEEFPNNKVIGIHEDINVLAMDREKAIELLNKMIAHIKIMGE